MVSLGDTAISLHILQPPLTLGGVLGSQNPKSQQDLPKFQFSGGGGGGSVLGSQNPKCQDLPKFQFLGSGVSWKPNPRTGCSGEFGQKVLEACVLAA